MPHDPYAVLRALLRAEATRGSAEAEPQPDARTPQPQPPARPSTPAVGREQDGG